MKEKTVTIDALARMIQKDVVAKMATKEDMNGRFDDVDKRLTRIEFLVEQDYSNRIQKLEDDVRELKTKTGVV